MWQRRVRLGDSKISRLVVNLCTTARTQAIRKQRSEVVINDPLFDVETVTIYCLKIYNTQQHVALSVANVLFV